MNERFTVMNMDAYAVVWDRHKQRATSRHPLIRDAEAEAARLNAEAGKRAAPVIMWAVVNSEGVIEPQSLTDVDEHVQQVARDWPNYYRVVRVEIKEISDDE